MNSQSYSIYFQFLKELSLNRENIIQLGEESKQYEAVQSIFIDLVKNEDEQYQSNLKRKLNFILENQQVSIDELIQLLSFQLEINDIFELKGRDAEAEFDRKFGIETESIFEQFELPENVSTGRLANCTRYIATPIKTFRNSLERLKGQGLDFCNFIFIDIGSGMGRNLLLASEYPFKKIMGVEISPYLHEQAQLNIKQFNSINNPDIAIESICENALNFEYPLHNLVLYFWVPFNSVISKPFTEKLLNFAKSSEKEIYLIFIDHVFEEVKGSPYFKRLEYDQYQMTANKFFEISIFRIESQFLQPQNVHV